MSRSKDSGLLFLFLYCRRYLWCRTMPLFILQCSFPLCPSGAVPWVLHAPIDGVQGTGDREPGPYEPLLCLLSRMLTSSTDGVGENVPWGHAAQNVVSWEPCMGSYGKSTWIHTLRGTPRLRDCAGSLWGFSIILGFSEDPPNSRYFYWWIIVPSNRTDE